VTIEVALVDDQTLVRQGIKSLLDLVDGVRVCGEAGDGEEALAMLAKTRADVVLLDVRMPKKTGLEVLAELRGTKAVFPESMGVILLTTFDDDAVALQAIRLGARGFLLKDVSLEQLAHAIRTVAAGGTLINPAVTDRVLRGVTALEAKFPSASLPDALTKREVEVLRLIAAGSSNREIALALGTAEGTVKNQASSIFSKLGVRDRTRAVLKAIELGYI
jgi:DNA-binding NarL/FixJ family response regulator